MSYILYNTVRESLQGCRKYPTYDFFILFETYKAFYRFFLFWEELIMNVLKVALYYLIGTFLIALGINLEILSGLGLGAFDALLFNLAKVTPLTQGQWVYLIGILFIILTAFINGGKILVAAFFVNFGVGTFFDLLQPILAQIEIHNNIILYLFIFILGLSSVSFGVAFCIYTKYLPPTLDIFPLALSKRLNCGYGKVKMAIECSAVVLAVITGYIWLGGLSGVGIGTIISSLFIGITIEYALKVVPKINV